MSLLGLDVGTTGCKAAAFSERGLCPARHERASGGANPLGYDSFGCWCERSGPWIFSK